MTKTSFGAVCEMTASGPSDIDTYLVSFLREDCQELVHADLALELVVFATSAADGDAAWIKWRLFGIEKPELAGGQLDLCLLEKYLNGLGFSF